MDDGYEVKTEEYFEDARRERVQVRPDECQRLLDVGCGSGAFGANVKESRGIEVWGVEPFDKAATEAEFKLDRVIHGAFPTRQALPEALSRSPLNLAERGGRASYPQFTAVWAVPTGPPQEDSS